MDSSRARAYAAMNEIKDLYTQSDEVVANFPVVEYLDRATKAIKHPHKTEKPAINKWADQIKSNVKNISDAELKELLSSLSDTRGLLTEEPAAGWTVLAITTMLIECRTDLQASPIDPATSQLTAVTAENEAERWEMLASACEQSVKIVRATAVASMTLDRISTIECVHPEESVESVSEAVRTALTEQNYTELKRLAFSSNRSCNGIWEESDLRQYADEQESGRPFEQLIADLWAEKGYETTLTKDGSDGGVDVIATKDDESILIQAKRYGEKKVNAKQVREHAGLLPQYEFDKALLVTSTDATAPAKEEIGRVEALELINGSELAQQLTESNLQPPVSIGLN